LTDLGKIHIEKWKTSASNKQETLTNLESVQRNLQSALPEIITQLNNSPEDLSTSFKLYRNLDALYDVFGSVVESVGAFGTKDEFQNLSNDMTGLETARRAFGERMQKLTASKEDELSRLRSQIKTLSALPPPPPKKIVVDDTEPPAKPPAKKKAAPKPKPPGTTPAPTTTPPSPSPTQ
jgi:predicted  nucleic acid-binding Zn-ribbon protein